VTDYEVIYEHYDEGPEPESWGAYVPDLPCTVAVAKTRAEVEKLIEEAIEFHIEYLQDEGLPVPAPGSGGKVAA
jgi:predicted RNase H-like HicB family nuclease